LYEQMAVDFLRQWTGGVFGLCPVTVRPCRADCDGATSTFFGRGPYPSGGGMGGYVPALIAGSWYNLSCGACASTCSCDETSSFALPGPVHAIDQVLIDGQPLPEDAYRVDNRRLLVRMDGGLWPVCQDLSADPTQPGTWQVSYLRGLPVPVGGQVAAGVLACEFEKAACKDASCKLPERLKQVTRQGVSVTIFDEFAEIGQGGTGLYLVDSWVASVTNAPRPSRVVSVDRPTRPHRVQTWP
jgi:hypothetical protein